MHTYLLVFYHLYICKREILSYFEGNNSDTVSSFLSECLFICDRRALVLFQNLLKSNAIMKRGTLMVKVNVAWHLLLRKKIYSSSLKETTIHFKMVLTFWMQCYPNWFQINYGLNECLFNSCILDGFGFAGRGHFLYMLGNHNLHGLHARIESSFVYLSNTCLQLFYTKEAYGRLNIYIRAQNLSEVEEFYNVIWIEIRTSKLLRDTLAISMSFSILILCIASYSGCDEIFV